MYQIIHCLQKNIQKKIKKNIEPVKWSVNGLPYILQQKENKLSKCIRR